jgi:glycosyltransferase involved in cell wall biosynthesis
VVERGHQVLWVSSRAEGLPEREVVGGVEIVRRGSELTTRLHAPAIVRRFAPDVVLEEINTLPYFAPQWSSAPVVLYMNQLARDVWWYEAPLPMAVVGWTVEPLYLKAYRNCDAVTISSSSRDDLRDVGIRGRIVVVPMAGEHRSLESFPPKALMGRMVAIGRLTPSKRYDHAVRALAVLRETLPTASLTLIGEGRDRERLGSLAARLGVADAVDLPGRVDTAAKYALIDGADVLVGTSVREGWGLTVTEAAARGVPSVVYDIPGFRDAVVDGRTGYVTRPTPAALAERVRALMADPDAYRRFQRAAADFADGLSFDATADGFLDALTAAVSRREG